TKDLHTADYTQLYDFLKYDQKETKDLHTADYTPLYNFLKYNQKEGIPNADQNLRVQNVGNQNGLIGVQGNGNQNQIGNGNL
nr:hypothetical protein [Tanacetum cinerariifolium]